jgi:hypothetical protein
VGTDPVVCPPTDQCHEQGVCNPATGVCSDPTEKADGTPCDDGDLCTVNDVCTHGVCGGSPKCGGGQICQTDGTCCLPDTANLHAAISNAASGTTLRLCAGTWTLVTTVNIDKNLTLIGAGTGVSSLDGGNGVLDVLVLRVAAGVTVTLQDLTITKGTAENGGGIHNEGTLTLRGVAVTGNTATYGGGIFTDGGKVTLETGSSVSGNTVTREGGGIYIWDGTVILQDGSSVSGNTATESGGGIYKRLGAVTLETGSRVTGNEASSAGGIYNSAGTMTLQTDAIICSNKPLNSQCAGPISGTGACPAPAATCPP